MEIDIAVNGFSTNDSGLAAYLIYLGFPVEVDTQKFPATYHFASSSELETHVLNWKSGSAPGNIRLFFDSYKNLLRRVKGER